MGQYVVTESDETTGVALIRLVTNQSDSTEQVNDHDWTKGF